MFASILGEYIVEAYIIEEKGGQQRLRRKVGNKAHPEGSMVEAYIIEEILNFCSIYFANSVCTRRNQISRHDDRDCST
jgi:Domain of unknown function (DUF4218)